MLNSNTIDRMRHFSRTVHPEDFIGIKAPEEDQTIYKKPRPAKGKKQFKRPQYFSAIDTFIDFQIAMNRGDFYGAYALYCYLKRILNY